MEVTAKEYLGQIKELDEAVDRKLDEAYKLESMATSIGSALKEVNVMESCGGDKLGDTVSRIIDLRREADELTDRFCDRKRDAMRILKRMDDEEYADILYRKYILYQSIYCIASEKKINYRKMKRMHGRALAAFEKTQDIVVG